MSLRVRQLEFWIVDAENPMWRLLGFGSWMRRTRCDGYWIFELPMAYLLHVSMRIGSVRRHWVMSLMNAHIYIQSGTGLFIFCWRYDLAHWSSLLRGVSMLRGILLSETVCHLLWGSSVRLFCEVLLWGSTVRFFCEVLLWGSSVRFYCEVSLKEGLL